MDIRGMHYDLKQKLNKIDSHQHRNLRVPEIDWKLNEALEIFIKIVAEPRLNSYLGFEVNQRTIDDIRTLVVNSHILTPTTIDDSTYYVNLPQNYMFYVSSEIEIKKGICPSKYVRSTVVQHDDKHKNNTFYSSSFEWNTVNIRFYENKIKIFTDTTFTVERMSLDFIKKPLYIHNAQDYQPTGSYYLPDNITLLSGFQNCELPEHTHREIVDIAVRLIAGDLSLADFQLKESKLRLNQFI